MEQALAPILILAAFAGVNLLSGDADRDVYGFAKTGYEPLDGGLTSRTALVVGVLVIVLYEKRKEASLDQPFLALAWIGGIAVTVIWFGS